MKYNPILINFCMLYSRLDYNETYITKSQNLKILKSSMAEAITYNTFWL